MREHDGSPYLGGSNLSCKTLLTVEKRSGINLHLQVSLLFLSIARKNSNVVTFSRASLVLHSSSEMIVYI